jgi:hypothetical protein
MAQSYRIPSSAATYCGYSIDAEGPWKRFAPGKMIEGTMLEFTL